MGVTRKDTIMNEHIRGALQVYRCGQNARQLRLRWYGLVECQDDE